jgi:hypothetical protein
LTVVLLDRNGRAVGTTVAEGNGYQAGTGALYHFAAAFSAVLTLA